MILALVDVISGFLAHKTRGITLRYDERLGSIIRSTIGLTLYIHLAPFRLLPLFADRREIKYRDVISSLAKTAIALGAGVVLGYLCDDIETP